MEILLSMPGGFELLVLVFVLIIILLPVMFFKKKIFK